MDKRKGLGDRRVRNTTPLNRGERVTYMTKNLAGDDFTFGKPAAGDQFRSADNVGALCAFVSVTSEDVNTKFGAADAAKCRYVIVLDGDDAGTIYENTLVFGAAMVPSLTGSDDEIILGRIAQGEAKAGQSPPFLLEDADSDDETLAMKFFKANAKRNAVGQIAVG